MRSIGLSLLAIALGVSLSAAGASAAGVRVLASDAARFEVEWTPGDVTWESVPGESGRTFRRPRIDGGSYLAGPGQPDVPSVVRMIGIPPDGMPRVRIVSVDPMVESAGGLAPGPEPYVETPPDAAARGAERRVELLDRPGAWPAAWAEIQGTTWVRGQRLARLVLHPFRYDAAAGELTSARRLVVRVEFGEAGLARSSAGRDQADWEALLDEAVPNAATARRWRKAPAVPRGGGDSFASSSTWLRVPVSRAGVYLLDYFTFSNAGVDPAGVDPRTVRVFSGSNLPLRESYDTPPPSFMTENALLYLDDDPAPPDGVFDVDDRFLFYALAPNGWANEYDPARSRTEHVANAYTDSTYYWITWGGSFSGPPQRMDSTVVSPTGVPADSVKLSMPHRVHFEENNVEDFRYPAEDGWQWEDLHGRGQDRLYLLSLDRVAGIGDGAIRARVLSHEPNPGTSGNNGRQVELKVAGQIVADSIWTHSSGRALVDLIGCFQSGLFSGPNSIRVNAREDVVPNSLDRVYTAWFDVEYDRTLQAQAGAYLKFYSAPAPPPEVDPACSMAQRYGKTAYKLQGFQTSHPNSEIFLFDVSDQHRPVRLKQFVTETAGTNTWNVVFADSTGQSTTRWYVATTMAGVLPLAAPEIVTLRGLRSSANGADYVVIYHPDFQEGAERLARLRASLPEDPRATMAVNVEDIYDEFSWGMTDPVAIRDFLAWTATGWSGAGGTPLYVTLVGDAAYDTKHYLAGSPRNFLGSWLGRYKSEPSAQYVTSSNLDFYTTDDFFGYLQPEDYGPGVQPGLDVAIGRYPVATPEELETELDKLEKYTAYEMPGQWQNRIVLTADDERTLEESVRESYHTEQVETLARERVPPAIDKVRIYLTEYPRNEFGKKPEAQEAFIDEVTRGALMVTYTGHGDQNTMAQEEVFVSQKIPELLNEDRYCVFSTFSCQVSRFDLLSGSSIAELLLAHPDGGAVTTFCSGGLVFPSQSAELNQQWLGVMFGTPYAVHTYARSLHPIGLSAIWAKAVVGATSYTTRINNEKYVLLGDPALTLRYGRNPIEFETATVDSPQVVDGLLRVVRGTVRDQFGAVQDGTGGTVPFNGTAYVHVTEQADTTGYTYTLSSGAQNRIPYTIDGATTYRGEIPVTNGRFESRFYLSSAVKSGNRARISVFALEDGVGRDASGATDTLYIAPTISAEQVEDGQGPRISISFEGYDSFVNGDFLFTDRPVLIVDLEDESGINLLPFPQFALLAAEVDGREQVGLADDYAYLDGSFTHGRVRRILPLAPGEHTLQVKAFDNVGNRGTAEVRFSIVLPSASFDIDDAHTAVYPNPFVNATTFLFQLTHPAEVDLKVFTITGRRIYEMGPFTGLQGSNRVQWDGRDDNGRILANGTYLYKLEASHTNAEGRVESDEFVGHVVKMR